MTNLKTIFKQKSKLLLIVLSLLGMLFSYSCSCRSDRITGGGGEENGGGKFKVSEADGNTKNAIVKSSTSGVDLIKINLSANKEYTFTYTVNDEETDGTKKITTEDFTKKHEGITAKDSLAEKVRKWETTDSPTAKTITIIFTVTADDTNLENATQNVSVDIKLTHAKKLQDTDVGNILKKLNRERTYSIGDATKGEEEKSLKFVFGNQDYSMNTYTIKNSADGKLKDTISSDDAADLIKQLEFYVPQLEGISKIEKVEEKGADTDTLSVSYNFSFKDDYEYASNNNKFTFEFKIAKN